MDWPVTIPGVYGSDVFCHRSLFTVTYIMKCLSSPCKLSGAFPSWWWWSRPKIRVRNWKTFFLFLNQNICCGYSKEPSQWDVSFGHPEHMFNLMDEKKIAILRWKFCLTGPMDGSTYDIHVKRGFQRLVTCGAFHLRTSVWFLHLRTILHIICAPFSHLIKI